MSCVLLFLFICLFAFLCTNITVSAAAIEQYAIQEPSIDGKYQLTASVGHITTPSLNHCHLECLKEAKCLSFFYNEQNGHCILHEINFKVIQPTEYGYGWKFYLSQHRRNKCLNGIDQGFVYHRQLNLCYNMNSPLVMNFTALKKSCQAMNAELIRISSAELNDYVKLVTAGAPDSGLICIQGFSNSTGIWSYDDGTTMTYFNWIASVTTSVQTSPGIMSFDAPQMGMGIALPVSPNLQQSVAEKYIVISSQLNYTWLDYPVVNNLSCMYLCERR